MSINLIPESVGEEIAQNVSVITTTPKGTQPLDRDLGIASELLDASGTRGQALLAAAVIEDLPRQEPRVDVKRIRFESGGDLAEYVPVVDYEVKI